MTRQVGDVLRLELDNGRHLYCRVTEVNGTGFRAVATDEHGHNWLDDVQAPVSHATPSWSASNPDRYPGSPTSNGATPAARAAAHDA